jgi:hypothetical protein
MKNSTKNLRNNITLGLTMPSMGIQLEELSNSVFQPSILFSTPIGTFLQLSVRGMMEMVQKGETHRCRMLID